MESNSNNIKHNQNSEFNAKVGNVKHKRSFWKKVKNFFTRKYPSSESVGESKEKVKKDMINTPISINKTMWVPDDKAQTCYNCQKQFAVFLRRHHCRICGNVFCKDCSSFSVGGKYWGSKKEIKVCEYCHEMFKKFDETLVETTVDNPNNCVEDLDSIDDNMKNLKRETKLSEYCKKYKKETEEYQKFLQMDKKYEEAIKLNLDNYYDQLLKHLIEVILKNENLYEKWFDKVYELTKKVISQVNPSFKDLNDSMNINDYIKIKTISYKDQSLCKVIDGYAFQKNVSSKTMKTNIDNPKILLLDCGLDYNRNADNVTNYENLMTLEPAYFSIIMRKIELVEPTVILVNKNVSRKIQETLANNNKISLVMNVKSEALKKIARCTKTYVLPSTDLIDQQTILGTCKKFRIEKIKISNSKQKQDLLKTNEYNLMILEGCDYILYATMILSGPDEGELKLLKKLMKSILLKARDIYLQKFFVYFTYSDYPDINELNYNENISRMSISSSKNSSISGFSMTNNLNNLMNNLNMNSISQSTNHLQTFNPNNQNYKHVSTVNTNSNMMLINGLTHEYFSNSMNLMIRDFLNGFDPCMFHEKSGVFPVVKLTLSQGTAPHTAGLEKFFNNLSNFPMEKSGVNQQPGTFPHVSNNTLMGGLGGMTSVNQMNPSSNNIGSVSQGLAESEVLKKVNSICEEPEDLELKFYSDKEQFDKPLGKLIIDLCVEADAKCDTCKKLKSSHIYYIYKKQGRLKIEMLQNNTNNPSSSDSVDQVDKILEWINRESTDFAKYNNYSREKNLSVNKGSVNYNLDIYSYGVCKLCKAVVTPVIKLPRELFNFSVAMFFRFMLFNHELCNRSDKREFNLTKQYIANNECGHLVNRDIDRIFITKMGTVKFSYEDSPIYIIEPSPMNERTDSKSVKYFSSILDSYLTSAREKSFDVLSCLINNFKFFHDHLNEILGFITNENIFPNPSNVSSAINTAIEKLGKIINKYLNISSDIMNFVDNLFINSKFEDYVKSILFIKKVYFRIVQVKIVLNNVRKQIRKLKRTINHILKMKAMSGQYNSNDKADAASENSGSNTIPPSKSGADNVSPIMPIELEAMTSSSFENIDCRETYKSMLKEISFFDEHHSKYSSDNSEEDLSSIIAYMLTSDKYRDFICHNNRFKLIEIKCERRGKSASDCMQYVRENMRKEMQGIFEGGISRGYSMMTQGETVIDRNVDKLERNESINIPSGVNINMTNVNVNNTQNMPTQPVGYGYNFLTTPDDEVYETSLLFDQTKNTYHYQSLDNHKIYQQLETELLSDEKTHFTYNSTNSTIMNSLLNWNLSIDYSPKTVAKKEGVSGCNSGNSPGITINSTPNVTNTNPDITLVPQNSMKLVREKSTMTINNEPEGMILTHSHSHADDEKLSLPGDNVKQTVDELEGIRKDLGNVKENTGSQGDNKTKIKGKRLEFIEDSIFTPLEYEIIAYYPRQFEALRITYCATYDEFILSIAKSSVWSNVTGGKSKADFYKSHDNKFILKCVNKHEFKMFIETGFQYFHHNAKFLFHKMPSALAKILGAYKIKIKNNKVNKVENSYVILMENLFYGKDDVNKMKGIKAYDLKGSKLNRYIPLKDQKPNQVLPDTNFKEDFKGEPIALERNMAELLKAAVHNDSLILSKMNVVDYSLLLLIDDQSSNNQTCSQNNMFHNNNLEHGSNCMLCQIKSIRVGIIDYVRKYTWDKQLEHVGKIIINRLQVPTIVNPVNYKERFKEAVDAFFIGL